VRYRLVASTPVSEGASFFDSDDVYERGDRLTLAGEVWRVAEAPGPDENDVRRLVCIPDDGDDDPRTQAG
jgi:hypothetical protein